MIPLHDNNPTRLRPIVTWLLVAVNVAIFLQELGRSHGGHLGLMRYAMVPAAVVQGNLVAGMPAWVTIFTSMFLHGGLLHIGGNMLYLIVFGNNIEDRLGHIRFVVFYFGTGFIAAVTYIVSNPSSMVPTLGASGAIAGVLGAYIVLYPRASVLCLVFLFIFITTVSVPAIIVIGFWILSQIWSASLHAGMLMNGGIAYWAHIGGFFGGIALLFLLGGARIETRTQVSQQLEVNNTVGGTE